MCVGRVSLLAASSRFCFQFQFNCVALLVAIYFLALPMPLRKRGIKYFTFVSTHQKSIRKNDSVSRMISSSLESRQKILNRLPWICFPTTVYHWDGQSVAVWREIMPLVFHSDVCDGTVGSFNLDRTYSKLDLTSTTPPVSCILISTSIRTHVSGTTVCSARTIYLLVCSYDRGKQWPPESESGQEQYLQTCNKLVCKL